MNKHLDNTPGGQTPDRATPANTQNPAPAMEPERDRTADQPMTSNARKRKAGASAPQRKKRFVL
jgi:hypothetical protein